jgi:DNA repair protein RadA/Sms
LKKIKTSFFCQSCGHASSKWLGKCPSCGGWNQFVEEEIREASEGPSSELHLHEAPQPIADIVADEKERLATGLAEMDRVLGGGVVPGSAVLVGGDPGIGKSTLLLQVCQRIAERGLKVLYCPEKSRPGRSSFGASASGRIRTNSSSSWRSPWRTSSRKSGGSSPTSS